MARRNLTEINAGSMADIAFLLLVFFLVVTTMDTDKGMARLLPPPLPDQNFDLVIRDRDVYEVLVNLNNELYVEDKPMDLSQLRLGAKAFLLSNGDNVLMPLSAAMADFPIRKTLDRDSVNRSIASLELLIKTLEKEKNTLEKEAAILELEKTIKAAHSDLDKTRAKLYAFEFFGNYAPLPPMALISVQNDNATSYEIYVAINNELEAAVRELRDEVSLLKFGVTYDELLMDDEDHKKKILAIRELYPQRISEAEPLDVGGFADVQ